VLRWVFEAGGPVMWVVFSAWIVVLAGVLDRLAHALGSALRRPHRAALALARGGDVQGARAALQRERQRAQRGVDRIDGISQLATSIGLFGTVLGLARAFFQTGGETLSLAAPEVLASGLSTALFTTLGGLVVYLFGQLFLVCWREWSRWCERDVIEALPVEALPVEVSA
jgi:MotA/TolQ/ExbB proton channel family